MVFLFVAGSCAGGKKLALVRDNGVTVDVAVGSLDDIAPKEADAEEENEIGIGVEAQIEYATV